MPESLTEGAILTHVHDEHDWRLRRFRAGRDNHPLDPNWETGRYIRCHADARERLASGLIVFDVVNLDGKGVVRSAFQLTRCVAQRSGRILYFDKFWYPSFLAATITVLPRFHRTRYAEKLREDEAESLVNRMRNGGYEEYECGQIPPNVDIND